MLRRLDDVDDIDDIAMTSTWTMAIAASFRRYGWPTAVRVAEARID
jgi:hypothetical protein